MGTTSPYRRQFGIGLIASLCLPLAGCTGDGDIDENGDDENGEDDNGEADDGTEEHDDTEEEPAGIEPPELILDVHNESGEPVSQGFALEIDQQDSGFVFAREYFGAVTEAEEIDAGIATYEWDEGTYDLTVEPLDEEGVDVLDGRYESFEPVTETFEFGGEDTEVTLELDGALADDDLPPIALEEGTYRMNVLFSELPIGVEDASADDGANVEQQEWEDGEHQRWEVGLVDEDEAIHRFEAAHSGHVLEVDDASTDDGATVVQGEWEDEDHQRWEVDIASRTGYVVTNVNSGLEMVLDGDAASPGEDILQWSFGGAEAQMVQFVEL